MNTDSIEICGQLFDKNSLHFSFEYPFSEISDMTELRKLEQLKFLETVSLSSTNLNDSGLKFIRKNLNINNLNLQDTKISNTGIAFLSSLKKLAYLRLKENFQLDNACINFLNQLVSLIDLQIHETSIDQYGIKHLNLPNLRSLLVNECDQEVLISLSNKLPQCSILVKGKAEYLNGTILWEK